MEFKIYGELFSYEDAKKVAASDAADVSTSKTYAESNAFAYYVLINTWLMLTRDFTGYAHVYLGQAILKRGLLPVIAACQDDADEVVHGTMRLSPLAVNLYSDVQSFAHVNRLTPAYNIGKDTMATLLTLLRYPKRFSPSENDLIQKKSIKDFQDTENRSKVLQRHEYSRFVIDLVRDEVHNLYPWDEICDAIESRGPEDLRFSSGAGFDTSAKLGDKLIAISKHPSGCLYFPQPFGARQIALPPEKRVSDYRPVRVQAVPKSYKAARIIAMEDTYRLAVAKDIEYIFRRFDRSLRGINLEDQSINQKLAAEGSESGYYATLDASHASDTITKTLFRELFPQRYVELVTPLIGTHCIVDGQVRPMQMLSTSGHALTFRHETIVYKCVPLAADRLYCRLTGEENPFAWAYGDDALMPSRSVALAIEFYSRLGMQINESKSFFSSENLYRESCGEEYFHGTQVTSLYFPRFPIVGRVGNNGLSLDSQTYHDEYRGKLDNSLTMLIDLQKKLFPVSRSCGAFLAEVVLAAYPTMTMSVEGTVCSDLWGYQDTGKIRSLRAYSVEMDRSLPYASQRRASRHFERLENLPLSSAARDVIDRCVKLDTLHCVPTVTYSSAQKADNSINRTLYDLYCYQDFLKHGPRYADPLMELLGISEPRPTFASVFGRKQLAINMK